MIYLISAIIFLYLNAGQDAWGDALLFYKKVSDCPLWHRIKCGRMVALWLSGYSAAVFIAQSHDSIFSLSILTVVVLLGRYFLFEGILGYLKKRWS